MSPLYEYRCGSCSHVTEELRPTADRDMAALCPQCAQGAARILSAHHRQPDGLYSHEPNLGDARAFERKFYEPDG